MTSKATPFPLLIVAIATSIALLAGAHLFERLGGLEPCLLCLQQREWHWAAVLVGLLALLVTLLPHPAAPKALAVLFAVLGLVYLGSAGLAGYHAGAEWDFWDGPAACAAARPIVDMSTSDILGSLDGPAPLEAPSCEEAAWRFLGISMAGYNALISTGLAILCAVAAGRVVKRRRAAT